MTQDAVGTVSLPARGDGSRRRRRPDRPGPRGPRRSPAFLAAAAALVVVVLAILGTAIAAVLSLGGDDDGDAEQEPAAEAVGRGATGLLLVGDASGALVAGTLVVVSPTGAGGSLVYLPAGTMLEVPSLGLVPLREAVASGGDGLARQSVENLLGQPVDVVSSVDGAAMVEAVRPAGTLTVDLPARVERVAGDRVEVLFPAGPAAVTPEQVPLLLGAPAETDLIRLVRHQAFWEAWMAALGPDATAAPGATLGEVGALVAEVAAGSVDHHLLPVEAVGTGPGDGELYRVRTAELDALVGRVLPGAIPGEQRITVQVLNGVGEPGLAQRVQPLLVRAGARMTLSGNADRFDYAVTQIVYYNDDHAAEARALRDALGLGEVVKSRSGLAVVDVTVVLGADFAAAPVGTTDPDDEGA
jgi:polyisoprenyl-teichoic acid--peptidoglycan teichoic acid transferase